MTNTNEIWRIMKEYFENLYSHKLEKLEEMHKFLHAFDLPKLNQKEISHLNTFITSNEIEEIIVSQQGKTQNSMDSLLNSTRPLKKN
jgi:hypothetical protein